MKIRDRIKEFRRVKAAELLPHPLNWRTHPAAQREALRGVLAEIGYAGALLARELVDGSLQLIDGHLRAETTPDAEVPVLVLDLDENEAKKLLATFDPLSSMAGANQELLQSVLENVESQSAAVNDLLATLGEQAGQTPLPAPPAPETVVPELFQVVIECDDEPQQQSLFDRLTSEGLNCRLLNL